MSHQPLRDPDELRAFLFRIASNLIHDHWRRQRRERNASDRHHRPHETSGPDLALPVMRHAALLPVDDSGAALAGAGPGIGSVRFALSGYTIRRACAHTVLVTVSSCRWFLTMASRLRTAARRANRAARVLARDEACHAR